MAGFLTRRLSREHRKLVKQNELASAWLENLNATAAKLGLSDGNGELLVTIANFRMIIDEAKMQLATTDILSAESASKNVDVNRQMMPRGVVARMGSFDEYTMNLAGHVNNSRGSMAP